MKRVGIAPRWPRIWARTKKLIDIESVSDLSREVDELERYIETGITDLSREIDSEVEQVAVVPEYENWERNVFSPMISYATGLRYLFEKESEENKSWDLQFAARSFSAFRISFYSHFHTYFLYERRWGRKNPRLMRFEDVAMLSMGLIIGAKEQVEVMLKMFVHAFKNDYFLDDDEYSIYFFMLRIMADYFGLEEVSAKHERQLEPLFTELFAKWREPDPTAISDLVVAACDFHTHRCMPNTEDEWREFSNGIWVVIPIEILTLFKLREMLGLENPVVDHPMMVPPFEKLPDEIDVQPDDLVSRTLKRMHREGFDEAKIEAMIAT